MKTQKSDNRLRKAWRRLKATLFYNMKDKAYKVKRYAESEIVKI